MRTKGNTKRKNSLFTSLYCVFCSAFFKYDMRTGRGTDYGVIHIKIIITLVVINGNRTVNVVYNAVMRTRSGINIYTVKGQ